MSSMRWVRWVVPGVAAAWLAVSLGQQDTPPAPPAPSTERPAETSPAAPPQPPAEDEEGDDVFVPTEELAPDAAVTFPVDI